MSPGRAGPPKIGPSSNQGRARESTVESRASLIYLAELDDRSSAAPAFGRPPHPISTPCTARPAQHLNVTVGRASTAGPETAETHPQVPVDLVRIGHRWA